MIPRLFARLRSALRTLTTRRTVAGLNPGERFRTGRWLP